MFWQKIRHAAQKVTQSKSQTAKQRIGQGGENASVSYLKKQGMRILYRNWRHGSLEMDIIAEDAQGIVFVEVKTRKNKSMASALEGVHYKKRASLLKAAQIWLTLHEAWEKPCRFAVAAVTYEEQPYLTYSVEFYDNAFDFNSQSFANTALGGGNTPWQP